MLYMIRHLIRTMFVRTKGFSLMRLRIRSAMMGGLMSGIVAFCGQLSAFSLDRKTGPLACSLTALSLINIWTIKKDCCLSVSEFHSFR